MSESPRHAPDPASEWHRNNGNNTFNINQLGELPIAEDLDSRTEFPSTVRMWLGATVRLGAPLCAYPGYVADCITQSITNRLVSPVMLQPL